MRIFAFNYLHGYLVESPTKTHIVFLPCVLPLGELGLPVVLTAARTAGAPFVCKAFSTGKNLDRPTQKTLSPWEQISKDQYQFSKGGFASRLMEWHLDHEPARRGYWGCAESCAVRLRRAWRERKPRKKNGRVKSRVKHGGLSEACSQRGSNFSDILVPSATRLKMLTSWLTSLSSRLSVSEQDQKSERATSGISGERDPYQTPLVASPLFSVLHCRSFQIRYATHF